MAPAPFFNRRDPADIVEDGRYQVPKSKSVHIGFPLKENGSVGGTETNNPVYTKYVAVEEYDDATSVEPCCGVSEEYIPNFDTIEASDLKNIEFRHGRRDVAVCQFGVRSMRNMGASIANTGRKVAPAPGGFVLWETGMAELGAVKRGPIAANGDAGDVGEIAIKIEGVDA